VVALTFVPGAIRNIHVNVDGAGAQLVGDPRKRHVERPDRQALEFPTSVDAVKSGGVTGHHWQ
jgi:hypothetical protein